MKIHAGLMELESTDQRYDPGGNLVTNNMT
jgi:hypothetical protein